MSGYRRPGGAWIVILAAVAAGCASGPRLYINPEADMSYYKKVAVIPFTNLSPDRFAGARVTRAFLTELLMLDRYDVVAPEEMSAALDKVGGLPGMEGIYDPQKLKDVATQLGATGIIRGAVTEYRSEHSGSGEYPVIAFDVELVDVQTFKVVWRASIAKKGKGRSILLGGSGTRTFGRVTQEACEEIVRRMAKEPL
jgi:hypothetical protein